MKLSIVTINYNNKEGLKKTIESVVSQTFEDFEYIIIDGGSVDGSVEVIKEFKDKIDYWVTEKDTGIYNAMNKGIVNANGEYLWFLNSGDWLVNEKIVEQFLTDVSGYDIIYGNVYYHYSKDKILEDRFPDLLTFYYLAFKTSLPHQATLTRRDILNKNGLYDEKLIICSDWKFSLMAIFKWNYKYLHKDIFVVNYNMDGISSDKKNLGLIEKERNSVLNSEFNNLVYIKQQTEKVDKLIIYYSYSRFIRVLKILGLIKSFPLQ